MDTIGFEENIRPLFRLMDVASMKMMGLDLASYADVSQRAEVIYSRLAEGSMPCDDPWPPEHVQAFRAWIDGGLKP